jgi:hypothetical protein
VRQRSESALSGFQGRCGYGPRIPLLAISPYAKANFLDRTLTDQSSILRFIENNWDLGRIGNGSFDEIAGRVTNMFDFEHQRSQRVFLDTLTGQVIAVENQSLWECVRGLGRSVSLESRFCLLPTATGELHPANPTRKANQTRVRRPATLTKVTMAIRAPAAMERARLCRQQSPPCHLDSNS